VGYNNEKASPNQYQSLYDYCKSSNLMEKIIVVFNINKKHSLDALKKELPFIYESSQNENTDVPLISFDGGIASLFPNELAETKLIKVASASPPEWEEIFSNYQSEAFFHVHSGLLKWSKGADLTEDEMILNTIEDSLKNPMMSEFLDHIGLDLTQYRENMIGHLKYKKGSQVEDCFREIMEWMLIINFNARQKKNKKIDFTKVLPYLIVKDGSLYPYAKTVSGPIAEGIHRYLDNEQIYIVGMVKSSRFLAEDGVYRRTIQQYMKNMVQNTFFKLPKELEKKMDNKDIKYHRIFLSIFSGDRVYEVQIAQEHVMKEPKVLTKILDTLNTQITFSYGGSISTNSFAHIEASLSEREAKYLTENLREEIKEIIEDKEEDKDEK
jgi:hypothetical protein